MNMMYSQKIVGTLLAKNVLLELNNKHNLIKQHLPTKLTSTIIIIAVVVGVDIMKKGIEIDKKKMITIITP